jgi:glycosyltransferase involved in cell wall biosynthesis
VFRSSEESFRSEKFRVIEIEPKESSPDTRDDVAARGLNPLAHLSYTRHLRRFAESELCDYDLVLEKGWRLSGYLSKILAGKGVPTILIENDVRVWTEGIQSPRSLIKYLAHIAAQAIAANASRAAPMVIAETNELKNALVSCRKLQPDNVQVVSLGVDHSVFKPMNQDDAREKLGIDRNATVLLYVGGMDQYHDLSPLLQSLQDRQPGNLEIHLVGDGNYRDRYERLCRDLSVKVVFYGQVEHNDVPRYIAAADMCAAPYDAAGFFHNLVAFSTLKIPEYMACARPVVSIPSGNIRNLIAHGVTGYLFDNTREAWSDFLSDMPDRSLLAKMGEAAAPTVRSLTWSETARQYLRIGSEIANKPLYCADD